MITKNQRLGGILLTVVILLLIPAVAMQFSEEVNWTLSDFVIAAVLLFGTGLSCELVLRNVRRSRSRLLICGLILAALFLIWVELAVGLFGSPFAGS
ncbi:hypothetical protein [Pedobacter sp. SYSU D00535]|uniref:hypothetical protein n=1 Tax=Pedobacter sp. SYSU D00535 TaxID=2810308 RepID=UPI001A95695F|nr:hypothetical protein [Pedobacter sp. SYSU D00535]